jgi:dipeptidase D
MNRLTNSRCSEVFRYFEDISAIPRCSGSEKQISDYLVEFAKKHELEVIQDEALNVIIKKPAAPGYEKVPTVILQGHMDMVCEKNKETEHDFEKDPIKLRIVDDMIYASDTTLGADNGIALAYVLSILSSKDIPHPAIEAVFTADEENTMSGALALDTSVLKGKLLINLDSEEEGRILVSSAGGIKAIMSIELEREKAPEDLIALRILIGGLKGGHSGAEIDKGRGNANKLMGRLLDGLRKEIHFCIADVGGGLMSNAIPRESETVILIDEAEREKAEKKVMEWEKIFKNELKTADPELFIKIEETDKKTDMVYSKETAEKVISSIVLTPNGIQSMSMDIKGLVESSTNLGVITAEEKRICFVSEIRSSVSSLKRSIYNQILKLADCVGGKVEVESDYPEWEYNPDSKLRPLFEKVFKDKFGKEPEVVAIHAGLECGVLMSKMKGLDAVSIGPDMFDVHTPEEHISIASTERTWEYLLEVLKEMKNITA